MAIVVSRDAYVTIAGVDLSDHCTLATVKYATNTVDLTRMGDQRRTFRTDIVSASMDFTFWNDLGIGSVSDTLRPLITSSTSGVCSIKVRKHNTAASTDNPSYTMASLLDGDVRFLDEKPGQLAQVACRFVSALSSGFVVSNTSLPDGLETWWTFDETSGTRADSVGVEHLVEITNAVPYDTGVEGEAAYATIGAGEYLSRTTTSFDPTAQDLTLALWLNPGSVVGPNYTVASMGFFVSAGGTATIALRLNKNGTSQLLAFGASGVSVTLPRDNQFHHVVLDWDQSANQLYYYLDGGAAQGPASMVSPGSATIGAIEFPWSGIQVDYFGSIRVDLGGIWPRRLLAGERTQLAAGASWPFE